MYGAEHGFLLHTALMKGSWLTFLAICVAPLALPYRLDVRRGRHLERRGFEKRDAWLPHRATFDP